MKKKLLHILLFVILAPFPASAQLSQTDRAELFGAVDSLCAEASNFTEVIKFQGDLGAGAILKIVGVKAEGSIDVAQYTNLSQLLGETLANPSRCKYEMLNAIMPLYMGSDGSFRSSYAALTSPSDELKGSYSEPEILTKERYRSITFSDKGDRLLATGPSRAGYLVSFPDFREITDYQSMMANRLLFVNSEEQVYGLNGFSIGVWSIDGGHPLPNFFGNIGANDIDVDKSNSMLALGNADGYVEFWDIARGIKVNDTRLRGKVIELSFSFDGRYLAVLDDVGRLFFFDKDGDQIREISNFKSMKYNPLRLADRGGRFISWMPTTNLLLYGVNHDDRSSLSSAFLLNPDTGESLDLFKNERTSILAVAISDDARLAAFATGNAGIKIWDLANDRWFYSATGFGDYFYDIKFIQGSYDIISSTNEGVEKWQFLSR